MARDYTHDKRYTSSCMIITSVSVLGLRSHELFSMALDDNLTLIIGANGTGKTSLLEALYFAARGTSFRGRDRDMIRHGAALTEIKLTTNQHVRRAKLLLSGDEKISKQFEVEGSTKARLAAAHRLPVVLFEPDELRLLSSSPQRRRDFFDGIIARLSPTYSAVLARYQRTLLQRNELLKQYEHMNHGAWESHLFAWDVKLAELAATITRARINFIAKSNQHISQIYSRLASTDHEVSASYSLPVENLDTLQQRLLAQLERAHQSDALRGFTSVGPHRDDVLVSLDGHPANETASRGEMRTIMLAYKLLEVELQEEISGTKPLILMDDVFSELDITRESQLIAALSSYQTIVTATDLRDELKSGASIVQLE